MALKKIKELTPKDFTTLDLTEESLNEWLEVRATMIRNQLIFGGVILTLMVVVLAITGDIFLPGLLVVVIIQYVISSKFNKMTKKLGLTPKVLREARRS